MLGAFAATLAGYSNGYLNGADLANLLVPGLAASWEQDIYIGAGAVLAVVLAVLSLASFAYAARRLRWGPSSNRHRAWWIAGAVVLVLDAVAAMGNTITLGSKTLVTIPVPQLLMDVWAMFSSCARLAWLAGMLLALLACAAVLRCWNGAVAVVALAVCVGVQAYGMREELTKRFATYHSAETYANQSVLTDPAWETLAQSGRFSHLALPVLILNMRNSGTLAAFAAENGWTSNSFYMGHMDGNLAAVTLAGEMNTLSSDTLYVFLDEDELHGIPLRCTTTAWMAFWSAVWNPWIYRLTRRRKPMPFYGSFAFRCDQRNHYRAGGGVGQRRRDDDRGVDAVPGNLFGHADGKRDSTTVISTPAMD